MYIILSRIVSLILGFILDQMFGDPQWFPHPVRFIGKLITFLEKKLNRGRLRFYKGMVCATVVWVVTGGVVWLIHSGIMFYYDYFSRLLGIVAEEDVRMGIQALIDGILFYFAIACRDLADEAMAVGDALEEAEADDIGKLDVDLTTARGMLSRIVGRDTSILDKEGIIKATVETVAENASDGVIAPILFYGLFGPVGVWVYKANSTMDSMIGYRNERFGQFGTVAARVDDVMNLIPARVTAGLELLVGRFVAIDALDVESGLPGRYVAIDERDLGSGLSGDRKVVDGARRWEIYKRDCRNSESPNAGHPEAAMAAVLGIRLGGPATYQGVLHNKPYMGDALRPVSLSCIKSACQIMTASAVICMLAVALCWVAVMVLILA